ncbi:hypothetical protein CYMTET_11872 [Cymbomonas tetramitiformis]|uniref:Uncharacterized protein n=1 Tax=Cymbomonas tetramitiformis TaxID=36881 RepID=A0AAE0LCM2_9CHLO|nr:hypothetical protein CYMTET_11872 [Cymbomonas tetramitiformis]
MRHKNTQLPSSGKAQPKGKTDSPQKWPHYRGSCQQPGCTSQTKEHVFRWEAHQDQAEQTEEEQTIIHDQTPNAGQQDDQTREEEERQLRERLEQQEDEETLQMQGTEGQPEPQNESEGSNDP